MCTVAMFKWNNIHMSFSLGAWSSVRTWFLYQRCPLVHIYGPRYTVAWHFVLLLEHCVTYSVLAHTHNFFLSFKWPLIYCTFLRVFFFKLKYFNEKIYNLCKRIYLFKYKKHFLLTRNRVSWAFACSSIGH